LARRALLGLLCQPATTALRQSPKSQRMVTWVRRRRVRPDTTPTHQHTNLFCQPSGALIGGLCRRPYVADTATCFRRFSISEYHTVTERHQPATRNRLNDRSQRSYGMLPIANLRILKNAVFWDVTPGGSCKTRRFRAQRRVLLLLVTSNVVPSSPILVTRMMEAIRCSETSVLTRATRRHIPEEGIPHCHRRENLKSYIALTGWTL
jgi:hypothetical protein